MCVTAVSVIAMANYACLCECVSLMSVCENLLPVAYFGKYILCWILIEIRDQKKKEIKLISLCVISYEVATKENEEEREREATN